jgi:hypothetical protein
MSAPSGRAWFWTITAINFKPSIHNRGYTATREEATVDFKMQWLSATAEPQPVCGTPDAK